MRRNVSLPAATSFCWFLVLITVCACAPVLYGASLETRLAVTPPPGLNTVEAQSPGLSPEQQSALGSLPPELQGDLLMIRKQYQAAIHAYQQCPQASVVIWNKLGVAYQKAGSLGLARSHYQRAVAIDPRYSAAWNNLGTLYYNEKDLKKAEKFYRKALHLAPKTAAYYGNLGTVYFAEHRMKQGLEAYQQAFAIDPRIFLGDSSTRFDSAGATAEEEIEMDYTLASLYAQAGNVDAAIHYLSMAFARGFDNRKKLMEDKDFATLRTTAEFQSLLADKTLVAERQTN